MGSLVLRDDVLGAFGRATFLLRAHPLIVHDWGEAGWVLNSPWPCRAGRAQHHKVFSSQLLLLLPAHKMPLEPFFQRPCCLLSGIGKAAGLQTSG